MMIVAGIKTSFLFVELPDGSTFKEILKKLRK